MSFALLWGFTKHGLLVPDRPSNRSLHVAPVSRIGGVGILAGIAIAWPISNFDSYPVIFATFALGLLSFADDLKGLSPTLRLAAQFLTIATFFLLDPAGLSPLTQVAIMIATLWMTNVFNFMDGSDGLAGGMAVIGFGFYAYSLSDAGGHSLAAASIATASMGFLILNFHPAKIFLGDAGSIPLGFLAAAFGYLGWTDDVWPWWYPLAIFFPFVADASLTLMKRVLSGENILHAHCDHYYQRLIRLGLGHKRVALGEYALMVLTALSATAALSMPYYFQALYMLFVGAVYVLLAVVIDYRWSKYLAKDPRLE